MIEDILKGNPPFLHMFVCHASNDGKVVAQQSMRSAWFSHSKLSSNAHIYRKALHTDVPYVCFDEQRSSVTAQHLVWYPS